MKQKSFTLVEMLIVLSIISILSVSMIINNQSNQSRNDLLNASKTLALDIRKAQNMAMNSASESGEVPCGYGIMFYNNPVLNQYLSFYETMDVPGSDCAVNKQYGSVSAGEEEYAKELVDFKNQGIKIGSIEIDGVSADTANLFFSPPDPIFYVEGVMGKNIKITLKADGKTCPSDFCKSILANSLGQVSIE